MVDESTSQGVEGVCNQPFLVLDSEVQTAQILLSDHIFDAYYYNDGEEAELRSSAFWKEKEGIRGAKLSTREKINLVGNFEYQEDLKICLCALEADYNNIKAHMLILETFNSLGFRNQLTLKTKDAV